MRDILSHPDVYVKLMAEIDEATEGCKISAMPQYEEVLAHMPYFVACVKESMRLSPSAPNICESHAAESMNVSAKESLYSPKIGSQGWL